MEINNTFLKNKWVKEEIARGIRKYLETNEKKSTTYQNLGVAAKSVPGANLQLKIPTLKKKKTHQINNLTSHLEEKEQTKTKANKRSN